MIGFFAALFGYLLGSVPFGLVLSRLFGYGDIRKIGSGNIGATNVLRTGNKKLALAVLLLDGGKGAAAVLLAKAALTYDAAMIAGFFAVIGHLFPVWLKFKGGKGVATTLGTLLALEPFLGLASAFLWLASAFIFRISSLSALIALGFSPLIAFYFAAIPQSRTEADGSFVMLMNHHNNYLPAFCGLIATLVFWKHKENIRRLLKGEEPKIGKKL